jgi:hypothetical protein
VRVEGLPEEVRERLGSHVTAIVRRSAVPASERQDVAEELTGHLEERYRAARDAGLPPEVAASEAIALFGGADEVGRAFLMTYHSRLWASTIGQLLPISAAPDAPPAAIRWVIRFNRLAAIFLAGGAVVLLVTASPTRALVGAIAAAVAAATLWLAAEGLRRGQRWAVDVSMIGLLINVAILLLSLGTPPGGWTLSLNGLAGLMLAVAMLTEGEAVDRWTAGSGGLSERVVVGLIVGLLASAAALGFLPHVPDPTQIGPGDIEAVASVTCEAHRTEDGELLVATPFLTLDLTYRRVDVVPRGLLGDPNAWGDALDVRVEPYFATAGPASMTDGIDPATGQPLVVDIGSITGPVTESFGAGIALDDPLITSDSVVGEILGASQIAGRHYRITVPTVTTMIDDRPDAGSIDGLSADVRLAHLDRFVLRQRLACGERKPLVLDTDL